MDVKLFYLTVIALPCTVPICGRNTRKRLLVKSEYLLITRTYVYLVSQIEAVQM